jgi:hypothetical protein
MIFGGCCSSHSVAKLEGRGNRHLFDAGYAPVWSAVLGAIDINDLRVVRIDRERGHISARLPMGQTTFGENVSIWVHRVTPVETEVEVVSQRTGPPVTSSPKADKKIIQTVVRILPT